MDEQESMTVTMPMRTQEQDQLERFVPEIIEYLEGIGLDSSASELDDVTFDLEHNDEGRTRWLATTTADEWRTVISKLSNLDGNDVDWLRRKLAKRLHDKVEEINEAVDG